MSKKYAISEMHTSYILRSVYLVDVKQDGISAKMDNDTLKITVQKDENDNS